MTENAIETFELEHAFDQEPVLRRLSIAVPQGSVYGLLGRNGSGKTSLIKMLLGVLRPQAGRCRVLGLDPRDDAVAIRSRVGYVPQECDFDPQMSVVETLRFLRSFYPSTWRDDVVEQLLDHFEVPRQPRITNLSGGHKARLSLVCALAFEPELLILDEPTAGLDAVVRRDFIEAIIEFMTQEERTVFFCSHLLNEVELLADRVAILEHGRLLIDSSVDALKQSLCRVTARFRAAPIRSRIPGLIACRQLGEHWQVAAWVDSESERDTFLEALASQGATEVRVGEADLESIFVDLVGSRNHG